MNFASLAVAPLLAGIALAQNPIQVHVTAIDDVSSPAHGLTCPAGTGLAVLPTGSALDAPQMEPGWPITVPSNQTYSIDPNRGVAFADLDLDGRLELIRPSTNGQVYVFRHDGTPLPGWPATTIGFPQGAPTVADLDGDGVPELLLGTRGLTSGGRAYVFRADGTVAPGWPKNLGNNNIPSSPVAADLDDDGLLEVIFQERAYPIGLVHVFRHDGTPFGGSWPYALDHVPAGTPAVGDIDGDGTPEIVCISYNSLHVVKADGTPLRGFPYDVAARHAARFSYQSPALGDLDGRLEIVTACHRTGSGCYVFRFDGSFLTGWPKSFGGTWTYCPPSLADVDGDGNLDVVCGRAGGPAANASMYVWRADGSVLPGFPVVHPGGAEAPPAVADIDDDGVVEIIYDSNVMDTTGQGWLHCVDATGTVEPGWPLRPTGFTHLNGAQLADVDGDGRLEMAVVSRANQQVTIALYEPAQTARLAPTQWRTYHQGNARRGRVGDQGRLAVVGDASPGGSLQFELRSAPGNLYSVLIGPRPALVRIPGIGFLRIGGVVFELHRTIVGAEGRALHTAQIPNDASLRGANVFLQGLDAAPGGGIALLDARAIVIR